MYIRSICFFKANCLNLKSDYEYSTHSESPYNILIDHFKEKVHTKDQPDNRNNS